MARLNDASISASMNCREIRPRPIGSFCAILPSDPAKGAELSLSNGSIQVSARVIRSRARERCQDLVLALIENDSGLVGVFDGFGELGNDLPAELASSMQKLWDLRKDAISNNESAVAFVHDAALLAVRSIKENLRKSQKDEKGPTGTPGFMPVIKSLPYGGSTAMLAFLLPEGGCIVSAVGDSACYFVNSAGDAARLLDYNRVYHDYSEAPLESARVKPKEFARQRDVLKNSIGGDRTPTVETAQCALEKGSALILATDGVTKNLLLRTDGGGNVTDIGGCEDIARVMSGNPSPSKAAEDLMGVVEERSSHDKGDGRNVREMGGNRVLVPSGDDAALIVLSRFL